ncbi:MAG: hypothetical protein AAF623_10125, partial [Planctomycetota bacterium]
FSFLILATLCLVLCGTMMAQDAVYRLKSAGGTTRVTGRISEVSPTAVVVDGREVPAGEIRRLAFDKEPSEVNRARESMNSGQYSDALEALAKIDKPIRNPLLQAEIDFIKAYSTAQISLRGGNITPQAAGAEVGKFINKYSQNWNLYPAMEAYGKLIFAFGKPDLAAKEFDKMASCDWVEYRVKGLYLRGSMQLELGSLQEAKRSFQTLMNEESNESIAQTYKLLAQCGLAKVQCMMGDIAGAQAVLEEMIGRENSDNKLVFANVYNSLGLVFEKAGKNKEASRAYLHTHLLYASESGPHAESLYHLALLWPKLEDTDRAATARETLKSRYRNSYWAGKL